MRGSDAVTPKIIGELKDSALLILILSKAWFASRWCRQEFTTFLEHHSDPHNKDASFFIHRLHRFPQITMKQSAKICVICG